MAGGFDGMGVKTRSTCRTPHTALASVMGVRQRNPHIVWITYINT